MKIKKYLLFFGLLLAVNVAIKAQKVHIELGVAAASFENYVNNRGENTLDNTYGNSVKPFVETMVKFNLYKERIKLDVGVNYSSFEINTGVKSGNLKIPVDYNLEYVALKGGFSFHVLEHNYFKIIIQTHLSYDILTKGRRTYNNEVANLYKEGTLDKTLIRYHIAPSIMYDLNRGISIYGKFNFARSFKEENEDSNIEEKYVFETRGFSVGVAIDIDSRTYYYKRRFK